MNTDYPRLVTNGTLYRIQLSKESFHKEMSEWGSYVWETARFGAARRKFKRVLRDLEYQESTKPDKWKSICC